jgi:periplasmic divalent cation tolerance protein
MKPTSEYAIVFVTAPDLETARLLAAKTLEAGVIACANLVPGIESHYRWQGKLESSSEVLLVLKTTLGALDSLEKIILQHHPYDTPEIVSVPISNGNERYLEWLGASSSAGRAAE